MKHAYFRLRILYCTSIYFTSYHRRKPTEDNGSMDGKIHKIINTLSKSKILRMSRSSFTLALCLKKKKKNKQLLTTYRTVSSYR